jgi:hypothetical protein
MAIDWSDVTRLNILDEDLNRSLKKEGGRHLFM